MGPCIQIYTKKHTIDTINKFIENNSTDVHRAKKGNSWKMYIGNCEYTITSNIANKEQMLDENILVEELLTEEIIYETVICSGVGRDGNILTLNDLIIEMRHKFEVLAVVDSGQWGITVEGH